MGSILTRRTFLERAACAGAVLSMTRSLAAQSGMYISLESRYSTGATNCSGSLLVRVLLQALTSRGASQSYGGNGELPQDRAMPVG
jgi:hypothetical protein